jgi:hypothetical protein
MLNKLLPKQVSAYWDSIKHGIEQSCPSDIMLSPESLNKYLIALMSGQLQCWMLTERTDEGIKYFGNCISKIVTDDITGNKVLLLTSLYLYETASDELWLGAFNSLKDFGLANGCKKITAYTKNPRVLQRSEQFKFDVAWHVVAREI